MDLIAYLTVIFSSDQLFVTTIFGISKYKGTLLLSKIHFFYKPSIQLKHLTSDDWMLDFGTKKSE